MPRAQLALGTHGQVNVSGQRREGLRWVSEPNDKRAERYRATTRYRDKSGDVRLVERYGKSKGEARRKLNKAIADHETETELRATAHTRTTLATAASRWLALVESDANLSERTKSHYRGTWERCVDGTELAGLPLSEVNVVSTLRAFLQDVANARGSGTAKSVRSVLSGVIGLAVEDGLLPMNACRSIRPVKAKRPRKTVRDTRRALTADERRHLIAVADEHPRALAQDVSDVAAFMVGTGVRISEALAVRWEDLHLTERTCAVHGTKSRASDRVIPLPGALCERLTKRHANMGHPAEGWVFPSPEQRHTERPRDQRNVARIMREVLDAAGLPWATPHSLRRTVVTMLLESGQSPTVAAGHAGHADTSVTLRVYSAKRPEPNRAAAAALDW